MPYKWPERPDARPWPPVGVQKQSGAGAQKAKKAQKGSYKMSYLELAKKIQAGLKPTPHDAAPKAVTADPTVGRIVAVKIASSVLDVDIWLAFKDDFKPDEGEPLAVFYPDELPFLATKD